MANEERVREIAKMIWDTFSGRYGGPYEQQPENGIARKQCDDLARVIAALSVQVPAGWKMVPLKFLTAMLAHLPPPPVTTKDGTFVYQDPNATERLTELRGIFDRMLAASPPAPASQVLTEDERGAAVRISALLNHVSEGFLPGYGNVVNVTLSVTDAKIVAAIIYRLTNKDAEHG